jgi:transcriptional regulator
MFVPDQYRAPAPEWALDVLRANPLATLVSAGSQDPLATHLPAIPDETTLRDGQGETGLVGVTLLGHLNRANPHWTALQPGVPSLLIFSGPHGYVSPTYYRTDPAAPTWNFTAIHVHGAAVPVAGREATLAVVRETVRIFERDFGTGWDMGSSVPYFERMLSGVGAFRLRVTAAEAMFKLSQEKPPEVRQLVERSFAASSLGTHRELAAAMRRLW